MFNAQCRHRKEKISERNKTCEMENAAQFAIPEINAKRFTSTAIVFLSHTVFLLLLTKHKFESPGAICPREQCNIPSFPSGTWAAWCTTSECHRVRSTESDSRVYRRGGKVDDQSETSHEWASNICTYLCLRIHKEEKKIVMSFNISSTIATTQWMNHQRFDTWHSIVAATLNNNSSHEHNANKEKERESSQTPHHQILQLTMWRQLQAALRQGIQMRSVEVGVVVADPSPAIVISQYEDQMRQICRIVLCYNRRRSGSKGCQQQTRSDEDEQSKQRHDDAREERLPQFIVE